MATEPAPAPAPAQSPATTAAQATADGKATVKATVIESTDVVFARSNVSTQWSDTSVSLLELAEQSGLTPDFSCRSGICNTCLCVIREGEVDYFEEPLQQPDPGTVLICCSRPRGRVVLEI